MLDLSWGFCGSTNGCPTFLDEGEPIIFLCGNNPNSTSLTVSGCLCAQFLRPVRTSGSHLTCRWGWPHTQISPGSSRVSCTPGIFHPLKIRTNKFEELRTQNNRRSIWQKLTGNPGRAAAEAENGKALRGYLRLPLGDVPETSAAVFRSHLGVETSKWHN